MQKNVFENARLIIRSNGAFQVSNLIGFSTIAVELCFFAVIVILVAAVERFSIHYWILQVFMASSAYRFFVILHECGHGTLFTRKTHNNIVGTIASPFCFMPYLPWKMIHQLHHVWVGVIDNDPTQAHLLKLKNQSSWEEFIFRITWKYFIPIPFIKFVWEVFWLYPISDLSAQRSKRLSSFLSVLACIAPHGFLLYQIGGIEYLSLVGPAIIMFYVIFEAVNLPQHSGLFPYRAYNHPRPLHLWEQEQITRTTLLPVPLKTILLLNFNLHVEHHLFPNVPWYNLPIVSDVLLMGAPDHERIPLFQACRTLRSQDPISLFVDSLPSENKPSD